MWHNARDQDLLTRRKEGGLYSRNCGYVSYGNGYVSYGKKAAGVEKSEERILPLRSEIPESTGFHTFPTAPAESLDRVARNCGICSGAADLALPDE